MEIKTVVSRKDLKDFIHFPWQIYKDDPCWVPPLISEVKYILDRKKNPFWEHAEQILFLALKNDKIVGRIAGIIDRRHIEFHKEEVGFFGFFECINDREIAKALLDAVRGWLKGKGMRAMRGPLSPSQNEECGLLIEGFDSPPVIMMTYNPRYYINLLEGYGLGKIRDLFAYHAPISPEVPELLETAARYAQKKYPEARVRKINVKKLEEEKKWVKEIYNSAWSDNFGFVSLTDREFEAMVKRLKPLLIPEFALFIELRGRPAGLILAFPDFNQALKHLNGRLFPFGWLKLLYYMRKIKFARLFIMGVLKEYRMNGFEAMLYREGSRNAYRRGYREAEFSWVLEDNMFTRLAAEKYGGKIYKTYRLYQMEI